MAILKSTLVNGDLTVTGSLNVQGDLTYVGVKNLRVKDHQIELNANDEGLAALAGADQAGIVIRGAKNTTKNPNSEEASILYNHTNDSLVINKTIEGTVSNATTAASADKVANKLTVKVTDETGSLKTVEFDGSVAKTVDVDLSGLQNQIDSLTGGAGSIATQINDAISKLDAPDAAVDGQYVSSVSETDGKISVTRTALPDYSETYDAKGAAAAAKTALIGENTDDENSDTIKGAKKYADSLASHYAAASHSHAIADVTGLQGALDGKAAKSHTHAIANVTGLQDALDAKQDDLSVDQLNAVNSGVTADKVKGYDAHVANNNIHVTTTEKANWNAAEQNAKSYANGLAKNYDAAGAAATVKSEVIGVNGDAADKDTIFGAKAYADAAVNTLSGSVAATDAAQNADITKIKNDIANITNGTTLDGRYVNVDGDTMTGKLTMNAADIEMSNSGIVFGNMKIVWNKTDNAIEFVPIA